MLGSNRVVLFFFGSLSFFIGFVGSTVLAATKVLRGTLLVLLDQALVLSSTSRVIESGSQQLETVLLELEGFGLFVKGLILLLVDQLGLTALLELLDVLLLLMLFVDAVLFAGVELSVDVRTEVLFFELFPPVAVELDGSKSKFTLFFRELPVLATSVQAHDILYFLLVISCCFDWRPFLLFLFVLAGLLVLFLLLLALLLFLLPFSLFVLLLSASLVHGDHFTDAFFKGLLVKARVVLEVDGHI